MGEGEGHRGKGLCVKEREMDSERVSERERKKELCA